MSEIHQNAPHTFAPLYPPAARPTLYPITQKQNRKKSPRPALSSGSLISLLILFVLLALAAAVSFVIYTIANDVQGQTRKKMEKRNISFTKEGMRVGVKEKTTEKYADDTQ